MKGNWSILAFCFGLLASQALTAQSPALVREPNTTLRLPLEPAWPGYGLTNAFGDLVFLNPVAIAAPPGETNRLFVLERHGRIMVITNLARPRQSLFLDLTPQLADGNVESGLLGLTFHPGYATNRWFYVFRTLEMSTDGGPPALHDQLSRFEASLANPNQALAASEVRLFAQYDDSVTHNGGDLHFGPDGYLYVTLGDSGPPRETLANQQPIDEGFFGAILRLDVDRRPGSLPPNAHPGITANYAVPPDNPFVGITNYQGWPVDPGAVRTEFFAVGFRNPWRMSFDPLTGDLYCGDVGGELWEEIDVVVKGGNYGWPYLEAGAAGEWLASAPPQFTSLPPIAAYTHGNATNQGIAVIGGVVYRGGGIPQLRGAYLFADNVSGHLWALHYDGTTNRHAFARLTGESGMAAFGVDPRNGDVLVANHRNGSLKRLVYVAPEQAAPFPPTLADTGAFSDLRALTPQPGIVPYDLNVPFWSDGALKSRWFAVPGPNLTIGFQPDHNWAFPPGAIWIKHFELELTSGVPASRQRLETRFLVKNSDGIYGVTYRWGDSATNASLVPAEGLDETFAVNDGGTQRTQVWHYPSRAECINCHSAEGGFALGFNTPQLHRGFHYAGGEENQIRALSEAGYFQTNVVGLESLRALAHATNPAVPLEYRVRSYLAANCAQCHQPGSSATLDATWDARITTRRDQTGLLDYGYIVPHAPSSSLLLQRISSRNLGMPPVDTTVLNTNAIALVTEWINSFPPPPWLSQDVGAPGREGSASVAGDCFIVSGSGVDIGGEQDRFHFLYQPITNNTLLVARVTSQQNTHPLAKAGAMIRLSTDGDAPFWMMSRWAGGGGSFEWRANAGGATASTPGSGISTPPWLKLVREGDSLCGHESADGSNWMRIACVPMGATGPLLAGLAVTAHDDSALNMAAFDNVSLMSARMASPAEGSAFTVPAHIALAAEITGAIHRVSKVEFFAGGTKLGEVSEPLHRFVWVDAPAGSHAMTARVIDSGGSTLWSEPVHIRVDLPAARAVFRGVDAASQGDWQGRLGADGFVLINDTTNLPPYARVSPSGHDTFAWGYFPNDPRALQTTGGTRVAAGWYAQAEFSLDTALLDGKVHRLALYFLDWDFSGRAQTVEVADATSGEVLDRRTLAGFADGKYLVWSVRGSVRIRISSTSGENAIVSGLFLDPDPNQPPVATLIRPVEGAAYVLPAALVLEAAAGDGDGSVAKVEFFANDRLLGGGAQSPFTFTWSNALAGSYALVARAIDELEAAAESSPVNVTLSLPPASVRFAGTNAITRGNWRGVYGSDGFHVVNHAVRYPDYAGVDAAGLRTFTWADPASEPGALQHVSDAGRIAATWVDTESLTLGLTLADGNQHLITLYFLDADSTVRRQRVDIVDAVTSALLDSREVSGFHDGKYLSWVIRGQVSIKVTRLLSNAVLSGLFFDPEPGRAPVIVAIELEDTQPGRRVTLAWTAVTGQKYRLQYKTSLDDAWSELPDDVLAIGQTAGAVHRPPGSLQQGFYRIVALP